MSITVVIPSYNKGQYLISAIESALKVLDDNGEIIVVDDQSTDGSYYMAVDYFIKEKRIRFHKNIANLGPSEARKLGFNKASNTWVAFLDADDEYLLNAAVFFDCLRSQALPSVGVIHGISKKSGKICLRDKYLKKAINYSNPLYWLLLKKPNMSNIVINKKVISSDVFENLSWGEDVYLFLSVIKTGMLKIPILLSQYNVQYGARGNSNNFSTKVETIKKLLQVSVRERSFSMYTYAILFAVRTWLAHIVKAIK